MFSIALFRKSPIYVALFARKKVSKKSGGDYVRARVSVMVASLTLTLFAVREIVLLDDLAHPTYVIEHVKTKQPKIMTRDGKKENSTCSAFADAFAL